MMPDVREPIERSAPGTAIGPTETEEEQTKALDVESALADDGSDPYYDAPVPLQTAGHGPAHPAGKASRTLGRLVAAYREEHGLTQAALGEQLGWPQPNVARLEAGHRSPDLATLDRLARRLGIEVTIRATPQGMAVELHDTRTESTGT
jgi:DNA-binding XRE family transcriptional regulator